MESASCPGTTAVGNHFSCSLVSVLVARVAAFGGETAVAGLLKEAGSPRGVEYLCDIANWISYDEMLALWRAGALITHHPQFARAVGEDAAERLRGSQVAALLRSLGSVERVYEQITTTSTKYSVVSTLETVRSAPGFAHVVAHAVDGFPPHPDICGWRCGLMTQPPMLFGLPPGKVEHDQCAAFGADACVFRVTWEAEPPDEHGERVQQVAAQLESMQERLRSMFATAADLIASDDLDDVLARITDRAADEVRAPRYVLAVRTHAGDAPHCTFKGMSEDEAQTLGERILGTDFEPAPTWLVAPVHSTRRDYGRLVAMYDEARGFFPQERELFDVYARYAASALDSATALDEARQRDEQSTALLELARALSRAGTSGEVALRVADAAPVVVDCDRVGVYLWDATSGELIRRAVREGADPARPEHDWRHSPVPGGPLEQLLSDPKPEPVFVDAESGDPIYQTLLTATGVVASIVVPLVSPDQLLGFVIVSVSERPERLDPSPKLLDRLSGAAALAVTALQNGHLVDEITYQALHDPLTGLVNRAALMDNLRAAIIRARGTGDRVTLLYLDLDGFKPVNDGFGHEVGDELLVQVGQRLNGCTRAADTVARLGGDEFALLLQAPLTPTDVEALSQRVAAAFAEPFAVAGERPKLGASIGLATFPDDADSAEALLRAADEAMFEAKRGVRAAYAPGPSTRSSAASIGSSPPLT
jgi:diguanylate cyclase (GGDEF)-like protein